MTKERITYLDVAKGLLILSVVIHHIPHTAEVAGVDIYRYLEWYQLIIVPFFMPAFFVVTGWCSNFDKPFKLFLWSNVKTILIPAFCLGAISNWVRLVADQCTTPLEYAKLGFRTIITDGGGYWFLSALFVAKLLCWVINRYSRRVQITWGIQIACLCIGIILYRGGGNLWHYQHALILVIFLHLGRMARTMTLSWIYAVAYGALLVVSQLIDWHPYITQGVNIRLIEIPLFLALSFTGTMAVLWLSRLIKKNAILEYWGKQSIILYCLHIAIYILFFKNMVRYEIPFSIISVTIVALLNIGLCTLGAYILNRKYFRWAIGRF